MNIRLRIIDFGAHFITYKILASDDIRYEKRIMQSISNK